MKTTNMYENYYENPFYALNKVCYEESNCFYANLFQRGLAIFEWKKSVLEIGCGQWKFTNYCKNIWIKEYLWIDLDKKMVNELKGMFWGYKFLHAEAITFLKNTNEKYDIIFMSHVFEHFSLEEWRELANLIKERLNVGWIWLNIMPNANSVNAGHSRFNDITHKNLYTPNSLNQVLLSTWFNYSNISHHNVFWYYKFPYNVFFFFAKKIRILWLKIIWAYNEIFTFEILSIIKK